MTHVEKLLTEVKRCIFKECDKCEHRKKDNCFEIVYCNLASYFETLRQDLSETLEDFPYKYFNP